MPIRFAVSPDVTCVLTLSSGERPLVADGRGAYTRVAMVAFLGRVSFRFPTFFTLQYERENDHVFTHRESRSCRLDPAGDADEDDAYADGYADANAEAEANLRLRLGIWHG